jgi:membrane protein
MPRLPAASGLSASDQPSWLPLKALPRVFRQATAGWIDDNAPRLGASLAFYTLLSLAPIIVIAVALAAVAYGQEAALGRIESEIRGLTGPVVARSIQEIIVRANQPRTGVIATLLGLGTLVFAASSVFVELHDAMNTIWQVSAPSGRSHGAIVIRLIRDRFYSFAAVVGIGFLLLMSLVLEAGLAATRIAVPRAATFMISYLLITALFAALYKIVPDVRLKWSDVTVGALIASLLFSLGNRCMGLYFAHIGFDSTYSAAASPILVLLWVYYSAQLFFWGAEFSKVYKKTVEIPSAGRP